MAMNLLKPKMDNKFDTIAGAIADSLKSSMVSDCSIMSATSLSVINSNVANVRPDNSGFKESFKEINTRRSEMEKSFSALTVRQDDFEKQIKDLENYISETHHLPGVVQELEAKLAVLEQQARDCNVEIVNLPERRNENLYNILMTIAALANQQIMSSDIVTIHRVPHADPKDSRPKNIIVKFTRRVVRDSFLFSSRSMKGFSTEQIDIPGPPHKVYVNEHLTLQNKRLYRECRDVAKKYNYKYVWLKNGTTLVRKNDKSAVLAVRTESDICKIK